MMLGDRALRELVKRGVVRHQDVGRSVKVQPVSIDLTLDHVGDVRGASITSGEWSELTMMGGSFALGTTCEVFSMPWDLVGMVMGKSSVGRAGLAVECAGLIDPGFNGQIVLELFNQLPGASVPLRRDMRIAQVVFFQLEQEVEMGYGELGAQSHYQGQMGITPSHLWG